MITPGSLALSESSSGIYWGIKEKRFVGQIGILSANEVTIVVSNISSHYYGELYCRCFVLSRNFVGWTLVDDVEVVWKP